jgi:hypothetical protein
MRQRRYDIVVVSDNDKRRLTAMPVQQMPALEYGFLSAMGSHFAKILDDFQPLHYSGYSEKYFSGKEGRQKGTNERIWARSYTSS